MKNQRRTSTKKNKSARKQKKNQQAMANTTSVPSVPPTLPAPWDPTISPVPADPALLLPGFGDIWGRLLMGPCKHGMPEDFPRDLIDAVGDCFGSKRGHAYFDVMSWVGEAASKYPHLFDHPQVVSFLWGLSAHCVLKECEGDAKMCVSMAIFMKTLTEEKSASLESLNNKITKSLHNHLGSNLDIVKYVDHKIPCNCLVSLKQQVCQGVELRTCRGCEKRTASTQCCSRCKMVEYCSEECQHNHWPMHKMQCKVWRGKMTGKEVVEYLGKGGKDQAQSAAETKASESLMCCSPCTSNK